MSVICSFLRVKQFQNNTNASIYFYRKGLIKYTGVMLIGKMEVLTDQETKDAIYRETKVKIEARKNEGCLAVEMELAGVQAVCDFYGWELFDFLVTGDVFDQAVYDVSELVNANHNMDKLYIAIEIAKRI